MSSDSKAKLLHSDDDAACGKFWEIYADEAKEYDEGLVKSWKEDMDVILVFAALYSAILTAFVIESYKSLQEDPADVSAQLLRTISLQLASPSSIPNATQAPEAPFTPTPSALACNILWFISLSLSLICAFLAMFIQQWSRHFMHRITLGRSPTVRARLIQFFYFGLKKHRMHIIVDVIPYLLHISLFYFFGGLSAFLWSVNRPLACLILAVLASLVALYAVITLLPVFSLSSPYQTPLSSLCWRLLRPALKRFSMHASPSSSGGSDLEKGHPPESGHDSGGSRNTTSNAEWNEGGPVDKPTLLQAMIHRGRTRHASQEMEAIAWTLRSLNDEKDFLKFIEALPGVLEDHRGFRIDNLNLLDPMLKATNPHCNVVARAHWLLLSTNNLWHTEDHRKRRRHSGLNLFWLLSRLLLSPLEHSSWARSFKLDLLRDLKFPTEIILALQIDGSKRDLSLSVMVLCMLHNCLSLGQMFSEAVDPQALQDLIKTGDLIFRDYSCRDRRGFLTAGWHLQFREQLVLADVISHLFCAYLQVAGMHFPSGFEEVCRIFHHHQVKPTDSNRGIGHELLADLTFQLYLLDDESHRPTAPSLNEFDSIFKVILKSSTVEDLPGMVSYITRRIELGWWTADTLQDEELKQLCNILTEDSQASPSYGTATWADTCKWIIVYAHKYSEKFMPILSMLDHIVRSPNIETYTESHPSFVFFVKLAIIKNYNYSENDVCHIAHQLLIESLGIDERYQNLVLNTHPKDLEPYIDERFGSNIKPKRAEICSGEKGINGSILFIQALSAHLPPFEYRQILEFFYHLDFPRISVAFLARRPVLLHELVNITKRFFTNLASNPSTELVDINRMLWHMWRSVISDGPWKDPNPWRDLNPQRNSSPRAGLITQRDPGPWGDPNPWIDPDLPCMSTLLPLLDLATGIISAQQILERVNEAKTGRTWNLYTGINEFDLISDAMSVKSKLDTFSTARTEHSVPEESGKAGKISE